jgi:hypothetical protein
VRNRSSAPSPFNAKLAVLSLIVALLFTVDGSQGSREDTVGDARGTTSMSDDTIGAAIPQCSKCNQPMRADLIAPLDLIPEMSEATFRCDACEEIVTIFIKS